MTVLLHFDMGDSHALFACEHYGKNKVVTCLHVELRA